MSRAEVLVVDSSGFIKCTSLETVGKDIFTVRDVIEEVKDAQTRQRLSVLPFELKYRYPDADNIRSVSDFARKTGDYASLSAVDVMLLALCRQLVIERCSSKGAHLRTEPCTQAEFTQFSKVGSTCTAGFYYGTKIEESSSTRLGTHHTHDESPNNEQTSMGEHSDNEAEKQLQSIDADEENVELMSEKSSSVAEKSDVLAGSQQTATSVTDVSVKASEEGNREGCERGDNDNSDDGDDDGEDGGWITPHNIETVKTKHGLSNTSGVREEIEVACMTTDFAMQNVLLQLGIPVVSVDGQIIRQIRTYVLRCFSCMKITKDTTRQFCPSCGHNTLLRLPVSVDESGKTCYHMAPKKQISTRGTKYSIPRPKGGRNSDVHILKEDQAVTWKPPRTRRMPKVHALDPDFLAQSSPFAAHDVTSRGAQIYFAKGGRGRMKNPNEVRKKSGKRKK